MNHLRLSDIQGLSYITAPADMCVCGVCVCACECVSRWHIRMHCCSEIVPVCSTHHLEPNKSCETVNGNRNFGHVTFFLAVLFYV